MYTSFESECKLYWYMYFNDEIKSYTCRTLSNTNTVTPNGETHPPGARVSLVIAAS